RRRKPGLRSGPAYSPAAPNLPNSPGGSWGILKLQPTPRAAPNLPNTPSGSWGIVSVQPTHQAAPTSPDTPGIHHLFICFSSSSPIRELAPLRTSYSSIPDFLSPPFPSSIPTVTSPPSHPRA